MRFTSTYAALAALLSLTTASDAPVAKNNPAGVTYSATIGSKNASLVSGSFKIAAAPNQEGANILITLYNLPASGGSLSYGIYTGNVGAGGDCSTVGSILNPYGGITGSKCKNDQAACEVGDLSDKHGLATITSGGAGTGYFSANYVDDYLSLDKSSSAFVGSGSVAVVDSTGAYVACANFVNAANVTPSSKQGPQHASKTTASGSASASASASGGSGSGSGSGNGSGSNGSNGASSSSTSSGLAARTAAPLLGVLGLAALIV